MFDGRITQGLIDTITAISGEAEKLGSVRQRTEVVTVSQLRNEIEACLKLVGPGEPDNLPSWCLLFESLAKRISEIEDIVSALAHEHGETNFKELRWWVTSLRHQVSACSRDIVTLAGWTPWLPKSETQDEGLETPWKSLRVLLESIPTLAEIPGVCDTALVQLAALQGEDAAAPAEVSALTASLLSKQHKPLVIFCRVSAAWLKTQRTWPKRWISNFSSIANASYSRLVTTSVRSRADDSYYDLLASEARLASFVAISKGDVPQEHWFRMGRQLTKVDGGRALISWTGTMFEYLMPLLVMRNYPASLLDETYHSIVNRQIEYGDELGVPWGVSESAYNVRDIHLNYQYGPFGVPGLGLKRGLMEDLVVAPYATMLAAEINPRAAMENLRRLEKEGALGAYGYYESIDYTAERLPQGQRYLIIRAFMTHHQGMSLVSLSNILQDDRMEKRFHAEPSIQATELLLQERIPVGVPATHPRAEEVLRGRVVQTPPGMITRVYHTADQETPRTQLLSNGTYNVMLTTAGGGYSNSGGNAVTRWREDVTRDNWGTFVYLRDVRSGAVWSAAYQPTLRRRAVIRSRLFGRQSGVSA